MIAVGLFQIGFTWLKVKYPSIRDWTTLTPTVVIENGVFLMHNIARIRYTVNDLLSMLRLKDIFQLSEVEYAIVEPSGHLSVLKKAESMPPAAKDLGVAVAAKGLPMLLIVDGRLITNTLEQIELTRQWLDSQLLHQGHRDIKEVYLAALEADGTVYIAGKKQTDTGKSMHY